MINYEKEILDLGLCERKKWGNMDNKVLEVKRKELILKGLNNLMDESEDLKQVLDYLCHLDIKDNMKVKITIQKQDFENSTNTTYEKIITK